MNASTFTQNLFNPHGGGVRAWCLTGFNGTNPAQMSFLNTVNGYNLNIDNAAYSALVSTTGSSQQGISTGAVPFKFVTPMDNTNYMIFVQPRHVGVGNNSYSESGRAFFAHAVTSPQYPKTRFGFWVRFGIMLRESDYSYTRSIFRRPGVGSILNRKNASSGYQLQVVVL
jgi:hypothetical protein